MTMGRSALLGAALVLAASGTAWAGEPGEGFEVERYAVELRPDLTTTAVAGRETIRIAATADAVRAVAFSPNALAIADARVDGAPVAVTAGEDALTFPLPRPLKRGERATLTFAFAGTPARGVTASPAGVHSGYFACDWMVCLQDAPGDKADLTLDLFVPQGVTTLGVGRAERPVRLADGLARHRWRGERPASPYTFAFAAGDFPQMAVETAQGRLRYLNGTGEGADLSALFAQTPAMVAFFADRAGLDLPGHAYAQLLVPGGEAQESASFSLIGRAVLDDEREDPASAWVIAHELAHQWWGNLVTTRTWRDFWLNEGFATYMVAAWERHHAGEAAYQEELAVLGQRRERLRDLGWDKPLAWGGTYPSLSHRRAVQYSKGALFLAQLREMLGEDAFRAGIRAYTRANAGGTVTSRDFQTAMERASHRDLSELFAEWVYGDDTPE